MANFTTHLTVGIITSSSLTFYAISSELISSKEFLPVTIVGIIGSIFPDIDLKESRASQLIFTTLGCLISVAALFSCIKTLSLIQLLFLSISAFVLVRYSGQIIFYRFTKHRGIWHSMLTASLISILGAIFFFRILKTTDILAWTAALFLFIGYIVHLVLDELYSVDYLEAQTKKSFGTALKVYAPQNLWSSLVLFILSVLGWYNAPSSTNFINQIWTHYERGHFSYKKLSQ